MCPPVKRRAREDYRRKRSGRQAPVFIVMLRSCADESASSLLKNGGERGAAPDRFRPKDVDRPRDQRLTPGRAAPQSDERQRCLMQVLRMLSILSVVMALALVTPALAQQFNWQQAKGTQLRVLLNKHPWQAAIEPHLKEFEALT